MVIVFSGHAPVFYIFYRFVEDHSNFKVMSWPCGELCVVLYNRINFNKEHISKLQLSLTYDCPFDVLASYGSTFSILYGSSPEVPNKILRTAAHEINAYWGYSVHTRSVAVMVFWDIRNDHLAPLLTLISQNPYRPHFCLLDISKTSGL